MNISTFVGAHIFEDKFLVLTTQTNFSMPDDLLGQRDPLPAGSMRVNAPLPLETAELYHAKLGEAIEELKRRQAEGSTRTISVLQGGKR